MGEVATETIRRALRAGRIRGDRVGGRWRITRFEVVRALTYRQFVPPGRTG